MATLTDLDVQQKDTDPKELPHVLWKIKEGFTNISADHVTAIVKWARSIESENAELRAQMAAKKGS